MLIIEFYIQLIQRQQMWSVSTDVVVRIIESDCDGLCPSVLAFYLSAVEMPIRVPRINDVILLKIIECVAGVRFLNLKNSKKEEKK